MAQLVMLSLCGLLAGLLVFAETDNRKLMSIDVNAADPPTDRGTAVSSSTIYDNTNGGGMVTVTAYDHNGLWEWIKEWWEDMLDHEDRYQPDDSSHAGTMVISDDGNGGGSITVTISDNKLFQRVKRRWQRVIMNPKYSRLRRRRSTEGMS
ncbi:hypothetical protein PsorP6_012808 [Peronosclerospora sorghi]|uniref:Uncharacterized protein n=1 Tax=Peronosclerospora sorghi TaxID=230839 RepID=A0ACC0WFR1_9STRA|nr:hypothetical protein PsorP6_012808 [Peronosclerospora sorghi]